MKTPGKDDGTVQVLLDRLNNWRLPRALELKERVDRGETLVEADVAFLKRVFEDANHARTIAAKHTELQPLIDKLSSLYGDITKKALENEQARKK